MSQAPESDEQTQQSEKENSGAAKHTGWKGGRMAAQGFQPTGRTVQLRLVSGFILLISDRAPSYFTIPSNNVATSLGPSIAGYWIVRMFTPETGISNATEAVCAFILGDV